MIIRGDNAAFLAGARVLLVEDEPLIALELEQFLAACGAEIVGPAPTVRAALAALQAGRPDVAVLDLNLRGEKSTPVARALKATGVPLVLATGYSRHQLDDPVLLEAPLIPKPVNPRELVLVLSGLLSSR